LNARKGNLVMVGEGLRRKKEQIESLGSFGRTGGPQFEGGGVATNRSVNGGGGWDFGGGGSRGGCRERREGRMRALGEGGA